MWPSTSPQRRRSGNRRSCTHGIGVISAIDVSTGVLVSVVMAAESSGLDTVSQRDPSPERVNLPHMAAAKRSSTRSRATPSRRGIRWSTSRRHASYRYPDQPRSERAIEAIPPRKWPTSVTTCSVASPQCRSRHSAPPRHPRRGLARRIKFRRTEHARRVDHDNVVLQKISPRNQHRYGGDRRQDDDDEQPAENPIMYGQTGHGDSPIGCGSGSGRPARPASQSSGAAAVSASVACQPVQEETRK